jgi:hypothetical protein
MNRTVVIVTLSILGLAVVVSNPLMGGGIALVGWIYLLWVVRTGGTRVFEGHLDSTSAERLLQRLKTLLVIAGLALTVFIVGAILHNVRSDSSGSEEATWLFVALVALGVFILATVAGVLSLVRGRRHPG